MAWRDLFHGWLGRKGYTSLDLFRGLYNAGRESKAGKTVNLQTALGVSVVFACARLIGNGMSQVPLKVMQKSGRTRGEVADHPLAKVFRKPNPWMTGFEFRTTMSWHLELCGNFYAFINRIGPEVRELIPIQPNLVKVTRNEKLELTYTVRREDGSGEREFPAESIWHVRGPSWNSWSGLDVIGVARDAIGLAIAVEEAQAGLHKNGVQPSGVYSVEGKLNATQQKDLRDWLAEASKRPGEVLVVDRAAKWIQTQMSGLDAQTAETRRGQIEEICRYFVVMPIMVGYTDKSATYASAEQMFLAHNINTLGPRWKMYEESMDAYLLTEEERDAGFYFDFVEEGMLAASAEVKMRVVLGLVNGGVFTPNEGRDKYELNPDPDPKSDQLREPVAVAQSPGSDGAGGDAPPKAQRSPSVVFHEGAITVKTEVGSPQVKIDNLVEPAAAPEVKVDARAEHHVHVAPPKITVTPAATKTEVIMPAEMKITGLPARESESTTERDAKGNIVRVKQTEKDA